MQSEQDYRIPRPRIETISDLIFGLALSIGAFSLVTSRPPNNLNDMLLDVLAFGFSFLVLIIVWVRYTNIMSVLPIETATTVLLNLMMLFLVSLEPYFFNLVTLFSHASTLSFLNEASDLYALDMTGLTAVLGFFTHQLTIEEKKLVPAHLLGRYKTERNVFFIATGFFLISIVPQFWTTRLLNTPLRFLLWIVPIIILQATRLMHFHPGERQNSKRHPTARTKEQTSP